MDIKELVGNVLNQNIGQHCKGWHINTLFSMEN